MPTVPTFTIEALNDAEPSENRIHSNEIALKYGFDGALVSGANLFGYLSRPLINSYGSSWLDSGVLELKFLNPAYHQDVLAISTLDCNPAMGERHHLTTAQNSDGLVLSKLESWLPTQLPTVHAASLIPSEEKKEDRVEIAWDLIHLQQGEPTYYWGPSQSENEQHVTSQRDDNNLYKGANGYVHPYYLLDVCNQALKRMFILPAWIHTSSRLILRAPLRVGQTLAIQSVPIQKWEAKGHQFIRLYISLRLNHKIVTEIEHTAIFRIAI